jgi:hypothetical protein
MRPSVISLPATDLAGENNANTKLLFHFDEDLGATTFYDRAVGGTAKTITALEDAQIERIPKWGFGAVGMHGAGSYIKIDPTSDFDFGTDDFSIDFWARLADAQRPHLFAMAADSGGSPDPDNLFSVERANSQGPAISFRLHYRVGGEDLLSAVSPLISGMVVDSFHHFAIVREGATLSLYVNGIAKIAADAGDVNEAPRDIDCSTWKTYIGASFETGVFVTGDAQIDEFRVQAEAVWSADFSVPTGPYRRRQLGRMLGSHTLRTARQTRAAGEHSIALRRRLARTLGEHVIRLRHEAKALGEHGVQARHEDRAMGVTNIVRRVHRARATGTSVIRRRHEDRVTGVHRTLTTRHEARALGELIVRNRFDGRAVGDSRILVYHAAQASGKHRVAEAAADRYEVYHGIGSVDFSTPLVTGQSLPVTAPVSGQGVHHFVTRRRNQYGEVSENIAATLIELDGGDNEINVAPSAPEWMLAEPADGFTLRVRAHYVYPVDGALGADRFLIYRQNITDGGPLELVGTVTMSKTDGLARVDWTSAETFQNKQVIVKVSTQRSSDSRESSTIQQTASFLAPVPGPPQALQVESF